MRLWTCRKADYVIITTIIIMQVILLLRFILQEFGCRVACASAWKKQKRLFAEFKYLKLDV
jgi:hypothetical protein